VKKIEFFVHNIDEKDIEFASHILRSIFLTTGETVQHFEQAFSAYLGVNHTIGVTSCTAAIHLSLLALGIGPGDEVITTPMSFCATANAVLHAGAKPVFVDVEEDTGNINAELIEDAITPQTKAIIPVHLYGQMCDMRRISEIAKRHNLVVIEDAAHCIEGERDGIKPGALSDTACFSFYATKNITSGEGGAIATNSAEKADLLGKLRSHGINKSAADRYTKRYMHWDMPVLGWKYNMDNIHASLLCGQLERIDTLWRQRHDIWERYRKAFETMSDVELLKSVSGIRHAYHLYTILVNDCQRDNILWSLQERGIGVAVNYRPIHLLRFYRQTLGYSDGDFPVAENIGAKTISLPLYPKLCDDSIDTVIRTVKEVIDG